MKYSNEKQQENKLNRMCGKTIEENGRKVRANCKNNDESRENESLPCWTRHEKSIKATLLPSLKC